MLEVFGIPGQKTQDCSPATGTFKKRVVARVDVGPFKVSGLDIAVQSLKAVFAEAEEQIPNVVAAVKSDGMLCVRHKRGNPDSFSNHSWGTAIDLFFGDDAVPQGSPIRIAGACSLRRSSTSTAGTGARGFPANRLTACTSSSPRGRSAKGGRPQAEAQSAGASHGVRTPGRTTDTGHHRQPPGSPVDYFWSRSRGGASGISGKRRRG
jgi:hypothetical protein